MSGKMCTKYRRGKGRCTRDLPMIREILCVTVSVTLFLRVFATESMVFFAFERVESQFWLELLGKCLNCPKMFGWFWIVHYINVCCLIMPNRLLCFSYFSSCQRLRSRSTSCPCPGVWAPIGDSCFWNCGSTLTTQPSFMTWTFSDLCHCSSHKKRWLGSKMVSWMPTFHPTSTVLRITMAYDWKYLVLQSKQKHVWTPMA